MFFWVLGSALLLKGTVSIVYNLRIAETTKQSFNEHASSKFLGALTLFDQSRKRVIGIWQNYGGGLASLVYFFKPFYLRVDAAVAHVQQKDRGVHFSKTQGDDILFSSGYSFPIKDRIQLTISGLLGVPTHHDRSLEIPQFGYAHTGLGFQLDGSFIYSSNRNYTLRSAVRCIHFLARKISFDLDDDAQIFNFSTGNLIDFFIAHHINIGNHRFEYGYDLTFLVGSKINPILMIASQKNDYIRNNFYASYKYRFSIKKYKNALTAALSYGFDHRPERYRNKRIFTIWGSWSVNF